MLAERNAFGFIRWKLALTQSEMADQIGVSRMTWNRWERGSVEPSYHQLRKIRDVAKVRLDRSWSDSWLFEVPGDEPSN